MKQAAGDDRPVEAMDDWRNGGFGLYFHWPYCLSKCPYCDFNSHVAASIDTGAWKEAFLREIRRTASMVGDRVVRSVYFGGGTPSLMPPDMVGAILAEAFQHWRPANDIEITLEANPTSVEAGRLRGFRDAGVNRVSMGLQAMNDDDLRRLGRTHSAAEGRAAFDVARGVFDRVSFDLIYARQFQSLSAWRAELAEALALQAGHMSLYQLTVEDGTVFGRMHRRGLLRGLPAEDLGADFYDLTQDLCEAAGLPAYEVSNHAHPGQESRHNLVYWTYGDYAGIGPGAHGRLTVRGQRSATTAPSNPDVWLKGALSDGVDDILTPLPAEEQGIEFLLMGLRLNDGINLRRFTDMTQQHLPARSLENLQALGMVSVSADRLQTTRKGRPLLNAILRELLG